MRADASHRISKEVSGTPGPRRAGKLGRALLIARADFAVPTERRYSDSQ
jgi:hypothetical protein